MLCWGRRNGVQSLSAWPTCIDRIKDTHNHFLHHVLGSSGDPNPLSCGTACLHQIKEDTPAADICPTSHHHVS